MYSRSSSRFRHEVADAKHGKWQSTINLTASASHRALATFSFAARLLLLGLIVPAAEGYACRERVSRERAPSPKPSAAASPSARIIPCALDKKGDAVSDDPSSVRIFTEPDGVSVDETRAAIRGEPKARPIGGAQSLIAHEQSKT